MQEAATITEEVLRLAMHLVATATRDLAADVAGRKPTPGRVSIQLFRQKLAGLNCGMTRRELDVCARTMAGLSAEGIAIDLSIKKSSVVTYRKRAYARLGISSQNELFQFII